MAAIRATTTTSTTVAIRNPTPQPVSTSFPGILPPLTHPAAALRDADHPQRLDTTWAKHICYEVSESRAGRTSGPENRLSPLERRVESAGLLTIDAIDIESPHEVEVVHGLRNERQRQATLGDVCRRPERPDRYPQHGHAGPAPTARSHWTDGEDLPLLAGGGILRRLHDRGSRCHQPKGGAPPPGHRSWPAPG